MHQKKKFLAVVNASSKTVPDDSAEQLARLIEEAGHTVEVHEFAPGAPALKSSIDRYRSEVDLPLIVWGGDGTICWALEACQNDVPVLALPGGTMNLVHKRIFDDTPTWTDLIEALLSGGLVETELTAGLANGRTFFVAAMFGHVTGLTHVREAVREGRLIEAGQRLMEGDALTLDSHLWTHTRQERYTALAAFHGARDSRLFDVGAIDPDTLAELVAVSVESGLSGWRDAERVTFFRKDQLRVNAADDEIPGTLDGEPFTFQAPVDVRFASRAHRVLTLAT